MSSMKLIMENWRNYMSREESKLLINEVWASRNDPRYADRSVWGDILSLVQTKEQDMESFSDELIVTLRNKSDFWSDIFASADAQRSDTHHQRMGYDKLPPAWNEPAEAHNWYQERHHTQQVTPMEIIKKHQGSMLLKSRDIDAWKEIVTFVLICHRTNIDHNPLEVINNVTEIMGEGQTAASRYLKWTATFAPVAITLVTGGAAAPWAIAWAAGTMLTLGPVSKKINDFVEKTDALALSAELQTQAGINPEDAGVKYEGEYREDLAVTLFRKFHLAEYQVLSALVADPHTVPSVDIPETFTGKGSISE